MGTFTLLSFLPILFLLILSLWKGVKPAVYISLLVTGILFFVWGGQLMTFFASLISSVIGTINILMIIFGAVLLYHIMEQKNFINGIKDSLADIHPDKSFRFYFLVFFLTAFFESVAGFGTPGAIVPLLLISLGYNPINSIASVLLIDGLFAIAGAVGTPVTAGFETPLQLSKNSVGNIYLISSGMVFVSGIIPLIFINKSIGKEGQILTTRHGFIIYLVLMLAFFITSWFLKELSGLIASIVLAIFSYFLLFKNKNLYWRPWVPYWLLVFLLLIPKIIPWFADLIAYNLQFSAIFGSTVNASIQPFKSPLIPFIASAIFALYMSGNSKVDLKPVITKTFTVFIILFPSIAITQLMLNSGGQQPSMVDSMASVFIETGGAFPIVSTLIGATGAFLSGSTTVSNIIFGSVQNTAAASLGLSKDVVLSLQLVGASLGNAICLFNIIAAAAVCGVTEYGEVLKKNLLPVFLACLISSSIGYSLLYLN